MQLYFEFYVLQSISLILYLFIHCPFSIATVKVSNSHCVIIRKILNSCVLIYYITLTIRCLLNDCKFDLIGQSMWLYICFLTLFVQSLSLIWLNIWNSTLVKTCLEFLWNEKRNLSLWWWKFLIILFTYHTLNVLKYDVGAWGFHPANLEEFVQGFAWYFWK